MEFPFAIHHIKCVSLQTHFSFYALSYQSSDISFRNAALRFFLLHLRADYVLSMGEFGFKWMPLLKLSDPLHCES